MDGKELKLERKKIGMNKTKESSVAEFEKGQKKKKKLKASAINIYIYIYILIKDIDCNA